MEKGVVHKKESRNKKNHWKESAPEMENCEFKTFSVNVEEGSLGVTCRVLWRMGSQTLHNSSVTIFYASKELYPVSL